MRNPIENLMASLEKAREHHSGQGDLQSGNRQHRTGQCKGDLQTLLMMTWRKSATQMRRKSAPLDTIGQVIARSLTEYFADPENEPEARIIL